MPETPRETMPKLQPALRHRPGKFCAVLLMDSQKKEAKRAKSAVASLMKCLAAPKNLPDNLHVLIAVSPQLAGQPEVKVLPIKEARRNMPLSQHDVFIQISAMTHSDLIYALRVCHGTLSATFTCSEEIRGGQLRFEQEPFGFYHGNAEEHTGLDRVARIPDGPLAGGSWILYQLYQQDMNSFYAKAIREQEDIMGAPALNTTQSPPHAYPPTAHTKVAHHEGPVPAMIRRGFAYLDKGHEGTAFIAASNNTDRFSETLRRMASEDALLAFAEAIQGGIYFAPPNADWLDADAPPAEIPTQARRLPLHTGNANEQRPVALTDYLVSAQFYAYIETLRHHTFFEGPVGQMKFNRDIATLLEALNAVAAGAKLEQKPDTRGGDAGVKERLSALAAASLEDANLFNAVTGKYMTVG